VAAATIGVGLLYLLVGPNWANDAYATKGSQNAFLIACLAAVTGGSYLGATLERPRVVRALAAKELRSYQLALSAGPASRFGANTQEVDALLDRLRTLPLATWDRAAATYAATRGTPWAAQTYQIMRSITQRGQELGEFKAEGTYLQRVRDEATEVGLAAGSGQESPATDEAVSGARVDAGVAMVFAIAAKPYMPQASLVHLWRPFEQQIPLGTTTTLWS
jgi:hypothetical protein